MIGRGGTGTKMLSAFRRLFSSLVRSVRRAFVRVLFYFIFISSKEQRVLVVGFVYLEVEENIFLF